MVSRKIPQRTAAAAATGLPDSLAVWLDDPAFGPLVRLGTLHRSGLDSVRFAYDKAWLEQPLAFQLDPGLELSAGDFYPKGSNFGVFLDSCPDRWGQLLMKCREMVEAREHGSARRELRAWDFLLGVQDATRMGALRFSHAAANNPPRFLADELLAAPPLARLAELQQVALEITRKRIDDVDKLKQWLKVLVAPGASLGGARPKANLAHGEALWIAKFPAADDECDVALWEKLAHDLARKAGIDVPASRLERFGHGHHTFLVQRFDRAGGRRRFFTSAMSLLDRTDPDDASYLELAQFIATQGLAGAIEADLEQMFRRVIFNVAVANRDDHLRNHGFIRLPDGWRLAPSFDMNPAPARDSHVLALDDSDTTPSLSTVLETAALYRLDDRRANVIAREVLAAFNHWQRHARKLGLAAEDIAELEEAFVLDLP